MSRAGSRAPSSQGHALVRLPSPAPSARQQSSGRRLGLVQEVNQHRPAVPVRDSEPCRACGCSGDGQASSRDLRTGSGPNEETGQERSLDGTGGVGVGYLEQRGDGRVIRWSRVPAHPSLPPITPACWHGRNAAAANLDQQPTAPLSSLEEPPSPMRTWLSAVSCSRRRPPAVTRDQQAAEPEAAAGSKERKEVPRQKHDDRPTGDLLDLHSQLLRRYIFSFSFSHSMPERHRTSVPAYRSQRGTRVYFS
jgi:hypothetical protein